MMRRGIVIGLIAGLFIGMMVGSLQAAEKGGKILEPKKREDIGLRKLAEEIDTISVLGRLALEPPQGKKQQLILHSKDAKTYLIKGELVEKLKSLLLDLGEDNLVSLRGIQPGSSRQQGSYDIAIRNTYKFDAKGNRVVDTQSIRYYHFKVTQILDAKKSDEEMPLPERDIAEERRARMAALARLQQQGLMQIGEIKGKVSSLNLRSPVKTVEVTYRDKDNQLINKVLLLSSNTRIVKKNDDNEEPMYYLSVNSLQVGQEVMVGYSQDERKAEVLFITITKE